MFTCISDGIVVHVVDKKPTIRDLTLFKWKNGSETHRLRIIENICNKWETIGKILYIPEAKLKMWWTQTSHDLHKCCNKVFDYTGSRIHLKITLSPGEGSLNCLKMFLSKHSLKN